MYELLTILGLGLMALATILSIGMIVVVYLFPRMDHLCGIAGGSIFSVLGAGMIGGVWYAVSTALCWVIGVAFATHIWHDLLYPAICWAARQIDALV